MKETSLATCKALATALMSHIKLTSTWRAAHFSKFLSLRPWKLHGAYGQGSGLL